MLALDDIAGGIPVLFPVHPRTRRRIADHQLLPKSGAVQLAEPLGYLDFLALQMHASLVLTDSGGIQEETTYLGVPCLTARPNTERPVTITQGTNRLIASERRVLVEAVDTALHAAQIETPTRRPALWDGHAAERIVNVLRKVGA